MVPQNKQEMNVATQQKTYENQERVKTMNMIRYKAVNEVVKPLKFLLSQHIFCPQKHF